MSCSGVSDVRLFALILSSVVLASAPAFADVSVNGNVNVVSGSAPQTWYGNVSIGPGGGTITVPGDLTIVAAKSNGNSCSSSAECGSGQCVDGVCCNTACNDACGACNLPGAVGVCSPTAGATCRSSSGTCDVAETCTGSSLSCPADTFASSSTVCRGSAGACDVAESCTGSSAGCPGDSFASSSTVCRGSAGACDVAESCTGGASCPADSFASASNICRASAGVCDPQETCTGSGASCPANTFSSSSTVCRGSAGACDIAEACTGSSATCPGDGFASSSTVCRGSTGACDVSESCTGSGASCPANTFASPSTVCRASAGACDVAESCTGSGASCPANTFASSSTVCRASAGACDVSESCTGSGASCPADSFASASSVCRASAGVCDPQETCTGSGASCPANGFASSSTVCRSAGGACDVAETCTGGAGCPADAVAAAGSECRASEGPCDVAETCPGGSKSCPADTAFAPISCETTLLESATSSSVSTDDVDGYVCLPETATPGSEVAYRFVAPASGPVLFTLSDASTDAVVVVLEDTGTGACEPDECVSQQGPSVVSSVVAGQVYHVVVDMTAPATTPYRLSVVCNPPAVESACDDEIDEDGDGAVDCDDADCQATEPACVHTYNPPADVGLLATCLSCTNPSNPDDCVPTRCGVLRGFGVAANQPDYPDLPVAEPLWTHADALCSGCSTNGAPEAQASVRISATTGFLVAQNACKNLATAAIEPAPAGDYFAVRHITQIAVFRFKRQCSL